MYRRGTTTRITGVCLSTLGVVAFAATLLWGTLCIGSDGHVTFEGAFLSRCLPDAREAVEPGGERVHLAEAADCCGPCTDLDTRATAAPRSSPDDDWDCTTIVEGNLRLVTPAPAPELARLESQVPPGARLRSVVKRC